MVLAVGTPAVPQVSAIFVSGIAVASVIAIGTPCSSRAVAAAAHRFVLASERLAPAELLQRGIVVRGSGANRGDLLVPIGNLVTVGRAGKGAPLVDTPHGR